MMKQLWRTKKSQTSKLNFRGFGQMRCETLFYKIAGRVFMTEFQWMTLDLYNFMFMQRIHQVKFISEKNI